MYWSLRLLGLKCSAEKELESLFQCLLRLRVSLKSDMWRADTQDLIQNSLGLVPDFRKYALMPLRSLASSPKGCTGFKNYDRFPLMKNNQLPYFCPVL